MNTVKYLSTLIIFLAGNALLYAQDATTTVTAEAEVEQPISVTGTSIDFGTVFPGDAPSIARTDAGAAEFTVTNGTADEEVAVDFILPATLDDGAGESFPITFGADDLGHNTTNDPAGATGYDPATTLTTDLSGAGELYLWLGASITVGDPQVSGTYSGDIDIEIAYTTP